MKNMSSFSVNRGHSSKRTNPLFPKFTGKSVDSMVDYHVEDKSIYSESFQEDCHKVDTSLAKSVLASKRTHIPFLKLPDENAVAHMNSKQDIVSKRETFK